MKRIVCLVVCICLSVGLIAVPISNCIGQSVKNSAFALKKRKSRMWKKRIKKRVR